MVHSTNEGKYSLINGLVIAEREHPVKKLIYRPDIPPYLFLSREDEGDVRHRKTRFSFGSTSPYVMFNLLTFWSWLRKLTWCISWRPKIEKQVFKCKRCPRRYKS